MHALVIEDDGAMAQTVETMLTREGFEVSLAALGEDGIALGKAREFGVIVLDLQLPDTSGMDVLHALRDAKIDAPVLVLSGYAAVETRIKALRAGADDYVTKPFDRQEFIARIRAVVRRSQVRAQSLITTGKVVVNLDAKTVEVSGARVNLTTKEYRMLEVLSLRKGTAMTKNALLNQLYGGVDEPERKIIDVFMCKLRKKLSAATDGENYIKTVWGLGYELQDPKPIAAAS